MLLRLGGGNSRGHSTNVFPEGHQCISSPLLQVLVPGGVVHDGVYEGVDGVHDEGDDAEPDAGGGPLPARLRHVRQRPGQTHQREGADAVDGEAWAQSWRHAQ